MMFTSTAYLIYCLYNNSNNNNDDDFMHCLRFADSCKVEQLKIH